MIQSKRTPYPLPEFSPRRLLDPAVFSMLALVLCATVWFCLLTGASRAYGGEPLRFDPPPVDTGMYQSQPADAKPPKRSSISGGAESLSNTQAKRPASEKAPDLASELVPDSTRESPATGPDTGPDTGSEAAASENAGQSDDTKVVHLFNTADMFRKSIANNAPQWERVANEVKKKLFLSRLRA